MRFAGGFITVIVVNPPEKKLAKHTSVHLRKRHQKLNIILDSPSENWVSASMLKSFPTFLGKSSRRVGGAGSSTTAGGKAEDGKSSLATTAVNEWSIVESKLEQFKSDERIRLLTALKSYNDSLTERANLLEKNQKMSRHNNELKMLLNINRQD